MKLNFTSEAITLLQQKYDQVTSYILAVNDGTNAFSSSEGCCMIGDRFLLQPITEIIEPYTVKLSTEPFTVYTAAYDQMFLSGDLTLSISPSTHNLQLNDSRGIVDYNVEVKQFLNQISTS